MESMFSARKHDSWGKAKNSLWLRLIQEEPHSEEFCVLTVWTCSCTGGMLLDL